VSDLARALRRAADAHGQHEAQTGRPDPDWPSWYAAYLEREQAGGLDRTKQGESSNTRRGVEVVEMKLEVVVVPVSDVDRAKRFYEMSGFRLDIDHVASEDFRVVQLTPPGSECSIIIGNGITSAVPGSVQGLQLVVFDIEAARAELVGRGVDVSEVFHDVGGVFHHSGTEGRATGPDPERRNYGSFASFSDPDGNGWLLQEVKQRAPGR
jgi:catechol 2,3-dioxygenase-like lactoylglutathione lyase family enzyme